MSDQQQEQQPNGVLHEQDMPDGAKKAMAFLTSPAVLAAKAAAKKTMTMGKGAFQEMTHK